MVGSWKGDATTGIHGWGRGSWRSGSGEEAEAEAQREDQGIGAGRLVMNPCLCIHAYVAPPLINSLAECLPDTLATSLLTYLHESRLDCSIAPYTHRLNERLLNDGLTH